MSGRFYRGEINALAGGTPEHAAMAAAIGWRSQRFGPGELVPLAVIGGELSVDAIRAAAQNA